MNYELTVETIEPAVEIYTVFLTNFPGESKYTGTSYMEAVRAAKKTGFETCIYRDGVLVATVSPISGVRRYWNVC